MYLLNPKVILHSLLLLLILYSYTILPGRKSWPVTFDVMHYSCCPHPCIIPQISSCKTLMWFDPVWLWLYWLPWSPLLLPMRYPDHPSYCPCVTLITPVIAHVLPWSPWLLPMCYPDHPPNCPCVTLITPVIAHALPWSPCYCPCVTLITRYCPCVTLITRYCPCVTLITLLLPMCYPDHPCYCPCVTLITAVIVRVLLIVAADVIMYSR